MSDHLTIPAARLLACEKAPYLSSALFSLLLRPQPGLGYAMSVTANWQCRYDQELLASRGAWKVPMVSGILVHEVWHVLRRHFDRVPSTEVTTTVTGPAASLLQDDSKVWGIACDLAINDGMIAQGFELPGWGCFAENFGLEKYQTAEWYFDQLKSQRQKVADRLSQLMQKLKLTADELGELVNLPSEDTSVCGLESRCRSNSVATAAREWAAKNPGRASLDMERWIGDCLRPAKVRWQDELRHSLRGLLHRGDTDYSWRRVNRRSEEILFPGVSSHRPVTAVVEDTSGSMDQTNLAMARDETAGVIRTLNQPVTVLCCDAAVTSVQKVYDPRRLKLVGGGGTEMGVGLVAAAQLKPRPEVVVIITDGHTSWPEQPPHGCRVITVLVGTGAGPGFGKTIRVES